jgi:hypothetical protein
MPDADQIARVERIEQRLTPTCTVVLLFTGEVTQGAIEQLRTLLAVCTVAYPHDAEAVP